MNNPFENPACRQKRLGLIFISKQFHGIVGVRYAKAVHVGNRLRAEPESETIAVDADDSRHRTAEGVEARGRIVRFNFVRDEIFLIKRDGSGIILKDRDAKILLYPFLPFSPLSNL